MYNVEYNTISQYQNSILTREPLSTRIPGAPLVSATAYCPVPARSRQANIFLSFQPTHTLPQVNYKSIKKWYARGSKPTSYCTSIINIILSRFTSVNAIQGWG